MARGWDDVVRECELAMSSRLNAQASIDRRRRRRARRDRVVGVVVVALIIGVLAVRAWAGA